MAAAPRVTSQPMTADELRSLPTGMGQRYELVAGALRIVSPAGLPDGFFPGAPDLAVEVVPPDDTASEVQAKVVAYLAAGSRQVWVVYPELHQVAGFHSAREGLILTAADTLDGGDLLRGFSLPVAELFD